MEMSLCFLIVKEAVIKNREVLNMAYILQKDNYYCYLDGKHAVCKTQSINMATRFATQGNARAMLNKASKKVKELQNC